MEEPQRLKPGPPPLAAMRPNAARLSPCRPKGPNLPRLRTRRTTKVHKEHDAGGGPCVRKGARPDRGPGGAWRASHAMLWGVGAPEATRPSRRCRRFRRYRSAPTGRWTKPLCKAVSAPSYRSYTSYWSYRVVFQSANQRGGVTAAPCPTASCYGTSQTCRGAERTKGRAEQGCLGV